jgi:hypothetical protein
MDTIIMQRAIECDLENWLNWLNCTMCAIIPSHTSRTFTVGAALREVIDSIASVLRTGTLLQIVNDNVEVCFLELLIILLRVVNGL